MDTDYTEQPNTVHSGNRQPEEHFLATPLNRSVQEYNVGAESLDIPGQNLPGGMVGDYLESGFPLYYVNDYMLSYLGFTFEEFVAAIDGLVINCTHPNDRERVGLMVDKALEAGKPHEVQYRILKKDGSYLWVNDVGKKAVARDGRQICTSAIRDIPAEKRYQERLEKRVAHYDHLFHSVLTGIVQYRMVDGAVEFKNANQEVIRLSGCTPEELWSKWDWDLASLIAPEDRDRVLAEVERLRQPGDMSPSEYRMIQKDGNQCWIISRAEMIIDTDEEQVIQSVFLDINKQKMAEQQNERFTEQVKTSNEILHLMLEHTNTCEVYYYPQTGTYLVPERTCNIYKCETRYTDTPGSFAETQVDEESRPASYEMYKRIHRGEHMTFCEFRGGNGSYRCRQVFSVARIGKDGVSQLAIGILEDINRQKEMELALLKARSGDRLTGLYNRETGIQMIQGYLSRRPVREYGMLVFLDMDDSDIINQKKGRVFANAVLQETADLLKAETRPDNILIRLGGDEFMPFLKKRDRKTASRTGVRLAGLARNILEKTERDIQVSVGVGMCSAEAAGNYNTLYRCAASTLKFIKENNKGTACSYPNAQIADARLAQIDMEEHLINKIETGSSLADGDLGPLALDLLGKTKSLDDAVSLLLVRVGKTCGFDRASIIEANRVYLTCRFSYQRARRHSDLQLGQDFYVSEEDFELYSTTYDEDGLANRNLRDGISNIASCLHAGIWDYGEYVGSMNFEVDKKGFVWTKEHRKPLMELVKIVPSSIMKSKADIISQAKTDFLPRMPHEIRTPTNVISGMTTTVKSAVHDSAKTLDCPEKIESSNVYLLNPVNDILDMSCIGSGKLELNYGALDLSQLLESLNSPFHAQAQGKGLSMRLEDGRVRNRPLRADSLRLNQVLVNMIGNAVKFTSQGSTTVRAEELETEPKAVYRFSVMDIGCGIEPSSLSRTFSPFEQADASMAFRQGGTGLGLSISYRLVQMMGGILEVQSEVGKGSRFLFMLAFSYAPEEVSEQADTKTPVPLPDFHGRRVLLAEDNELNREIAQILPEMNGFTVECAANGQEALEFFYSEEPGRFDVVLMDIRMPVMDGLEAIHRIRTCGHPDARTTPIIALSANVFDEDPKKPLESGIDGHLSKPIEVEKLLREPERCMNGGCRIS